MRKAVGDAGTSWEIRTAMAARGWVSQVRLSSSCSSRGPFFQCWISRWDWHGRVSDKINFHDGGALVDPARREQSADAMLGVVRRTALVACAAWEQFPASVPCMIPGGRLVLNEIATSHAFGQGGYRQDGRGRPTDIAARG